MTRSLLLAAALFAAATSISSAETVGSGGGGPAGGAFMSTYANQGARFDQRAAPPAEFAQSRATAVDVPATASTRPAPQRRAR